MGLAPGSRSADGTCGRGREQGLQQRGDGGVGNPLELPPPLMTALDALYPRLGGSKAGMEYAHFDRAAPVLGGDNEAALLRAAGEQITPLYGTLCRSIPVFFLQDDHDHFDNDEATDEAVTFPPDNFMLQAARATQLLWYPEFLPDPNRPRRRRQALGRASEAVLAARLAYSA